jgi:hypothetical protein
LIARDFGEHRKTTTCATSLASSRSRMELRSAIACSTACGAVPCAVARAATSGAVRSVRVRPGCTTVTLMPEGPSSSARFLVSAATATLRMLPTVLPVWRAASPLTLTMRPQPRVRMPLATSRAQRR